MEFNKKLSIRLFFVFLLLLSFSQLGFPLEVLIVLGIVFVLLMLYRDKLKSKIESLFHIHIPGFKNLHPWARTALILIGFYIVYIILKQMIYFGLSLIGFDINLMISNYLDTLSWKSQLSNALVSICHAIINDAIGNMQG